MPHSIVPLFPARSRAEPSILRARAAQRGGSSEESFRSGALRERKDLFEGVGVNRACTQCHANAGANVVDEEDPDEAFNDNFDTATRLLDLAPLFQKDEPSQAYRGFVDRCLRERGYDPVGWE